MKRRDHYRGAVAEQYESKRRGMLWEREQRAVRDLVATWGPDESVIDVPVGTGRFLPLYGEHRVVGVDVSEDMLEQAERKHTGALLTVGDIFDLDYPDDEFDHAVCFRLLNWMDLDEAGKAMRELRRVTTGTVCMSVTVLIGPPRKHCARIIHEPDAFLETVEAAGLSVDAIDVLREYNSHRYQVVRAS